MNGAHVKRSHLKLMITVGAIVVVASIAGVFAIRSSAASTDGQAPAWLQSATAKAVGSNSGVPSSGSAEWVLTTVGAYHAMIPDQGPADPAFADKSLYVVFVTGKFSAPHTIAAGAAPTGTQLVLSFDSETQELSGLGILKTPVDPASLGTVREMAL